MVFRSSRILWVAGWVGKIEEVGEGRYGSGSELDIGSEGVEVHVHTCALCKCMEALRTGARLEKAVKRKLQMTAEAASQWIRRRQMRLKHEGNTYLPVVQKCCSGRPTECFCTAKGENITADVVTDLLEVQINLDD